MPCLHEQNTFCMQTKTFCFKACFNRKCKIFLTFKNMVYMYTFIFGMPFLTTYIKIVVSFQAYSPFTVLLFSKRNVSLFLLSVELKIIWNLNLSGELIISVLTLSLKALLGIALTFSYLHRPSIRFRPELAIVNKNVHVTSSREKHVGKMKGLLLV